MAARITISEEFKPRWYQAEAVNALFEYFNQGKPGTHGNPLIVIPTGGGKSPVMGMFCKLVIEAWPAQRILIVSHVAGILEQNFCTLLNFLPQEKVGAYSAGMKIKMKRSVTVAGIQTIYNQPELFADTNIILIDEAHCVPPGSEGMYRKFLSKFKCPIVGFTATHFRLKSGYLHKGTGRLFTDIIYEAPILPLIEQGYLSKLVSKCPHTLIDVTGVGVRGGEFIPAQLAERTKRPGIKTRIIEELIKYKTQYKRWLIFAINILDCEDITIRLNDIGINAVAVHSEKVDKENNLAKQMFHDGQYQALVSVESLTTGFDCPAVDLIALLRPTKSPVLHIQMIGRGLRIHPDKEHCLILDFAGNVTRLGPINDVQVPTGKKKKTGEAVVKICPECNEILHGSIKICPECLHVFVVREKRAVIPTDEPVVRDPSIPVWHQVDGIHYRHYVSRAGSESMLVQYICGLKYFAEYRSFNVDTNARPVTQSWWAKRSKHSSSPAYAPLNLADALRRAGNELNIPTHIQVVKKGIYETVIDYKFARIDRRRVS